MAFWITYSMKSMKEQVDDKLMVIKLFSCNYARDLINNYLPSRREIVSVVRTSVIESNCCSL
jgi:hypothetical protein